MPMLKICQPVHVRVFSTKSNSYNSVWTWRKAENIDRLTSIEPLTLKQHQGCFLHNAQEKYSRIFALKPNMQLKESGYFDAQIYVSMTRSKSH